MSEVFSQERFAYMGHLHRRILLITIQEKFMTFAPPTCFVDKVYTIQNTIN